MRSPCAPVVALILKAFGHCCAMCADCPHCAALAKRQQPQGFSAHCGAPRHERRRGFPHPAWAHPLARQSAGAAHHHPGARRRAAGRRPRLAQRPDHRAGPLDLRARPGRQPARHAPARPPLAPGRRQGARRQTWRPRLARGSPQLSATRWRHPRRREGRAVRRRGRGPRRARTTGTIFASSSRPRTRRRWATSRPSHAN